MSCPPVLASVMAQARNLRPALDGIAVVLASIPAPPVPAVALGIRIVTAAAAADCDPETTAREFVRGTMMICPHLDTLERWGVPVAPLRSLCALAARLSSSSPSSSSEVSTMRAGSVRKSAGSAVALVALPLVAAPPYVASAMLPTRELYASTLARAALNMPTGMDLRPALMAQVDAELETIDAVVVAMRKRISPMAMVDKAAASARNYLQAIRSNNSPGPWSLDDVMAILNAPGTLLRVPTSGPVVDDVTTGAAPSSIATIVGGLAGWAVGGPVGAVAGAAVGSFLGRRSA